MSEKNNAALSPIEADKRDEHSALMWLTAGDLTWTWDAAQLRAASQVLASLADQLDEPRRNAGPGCTYTREDVLRDARCHGWASPFAFVAEGCVVVVGPCGEQSGKTWWEASAKAGLFGSDLAARLRNSPTAPAKQNATGYSGTTIAARCRQCHWEWTIHSSEAPETPPSCLSCGSPMVYLVPSKPMSVTDADWSAHPVLVDHFTRPVRDHGAPWVRHLCLAKRKRVPPLGAKHSTATGSAE